MGEAMKVWIVVAESECCCGLGSHEGPAEIVGVFRAEDQAKARVADLLLHAGKWQKTLLVEEMEMV